MSLGPNHKADPLKEAQMGVGGRLALDPIAADVLTKLSAFPAAEEVVLGGYLALSTWVNYRGTHDVDAWWKGQLKQESVDAIDRVMSEVASARNLTYSKRGFSETISFELTDTTKPRPEKVFSFQIATRTVQLSEPTASAWAPILIESFEDNVGSKMNALVNRGAPRDFTDIKAVVDAGLITPQRCLELWAAKNRDQPIENAKNSIALHLASLEQRRPLESIKDPGQRQAAEEVRTWFRTTFVR